MNLQVEVVFRVFGFDPKLQSPTPLHPEPSNSWHTAEITSGIILLMAGGSL